MKTLITQFKKHDALDQFTLFIMFLFILAPIWLFLQFETPWWLCLFIMTIAVWNFFRCLFEREDEI